MNRVKENNRTELSTKKNYLIVDSIKEKQEIEKGLNSLRQILKFERVDRRCSRIEGIWDPKLQIIKVKKFKGSLKKLGYQNKDGYFLFPEEALFLLETNRLELFWKSVTMSIQQAYSVFTSILSLERYLIYRKLLTNGLKVSVVSQNHKRNLDAAECSESKRFCYSSKSEEENDIVLSNVEKTSNSLFDDVFQQKFAELRQKGPQSWTNRNKSESVPYIVHIPINNEVEEKLSVVICKNNEFDPSWGFLSQGNSTVFGLPQTDDVSFYKFTPINLS